MADFAKHILLLLAAGAALMAGMRAMEHVWPAPATRVYICINDGHKAEYGDCRKLSEILEATDG